MTRLTLVLSLSLLAFTACKKKEEAGGGAPAADKMAAEKPAADKPAADKPAGGAVKTTPKDLFDEFTKPNADGMALLDKYHGGATFSGKVQVKGAEETGKPILWLDIDGKNHISLDYADVEKAKAVKDGDTVTVTCKIGGASGNMMMVLECK
jgi:hypothetical protein